MRSLAMPLALALAACGAAQSPEPPADWTASSESAAEQNAEQSAAEQTAAEETTEAEVETSPASGLTLRVELPRRAMRATDNPDTQEEARLSPVLYVVNTTGAPRSISTMTYAAFQLEWAIESEDGVRWNVTFLPPPIPPVGGIPPLAVTVPAAGEARLNQLYGVSGYRRSGEADGEWHRALPVGSYELTISGVRLESGETLTSPSVTLNVMP